MSTNESPKKNNKKTIIAILLIALAIVIIVGVSLAYFSDFISNSVTGTAGTLDLTSSDTTITRYYTEQVGENVVEKTTTGATVDNLNPGDIIVVNHTVSNAGNKSAHVRDLVTFTIGTNYTGTVTPPVQEDTEGFEIYAATDSNEEIRGGDATPIGTVSGDTITFTSATKILNGVGTGAEDETAAGGVDGPLPSQYKLYFRPGSGNDYQKVGVTFTVKTEAIQYRNNTSPIWEEVTSTEFSL